MEEPQRLTVASTWKFDPDGVDDIRAYFKTLPKPGLCKYEAADDVFAIDGSSSSVSNTAVALTRFVASFIEDEKDNDLLEKPKVTRIVAPAAVDIEPDVHDLDAEIGEALIEDNFYPPQTAMLPMAIKYWPEKGDRGIECFAKFSYILAELSELTEASVVLEKENKRIRVSSSQPEKVNEIMERLNNLEKPLSLVSSPQVANILNVGNAKDFRLRLAVYKALNDVALRRILIDRTSKITDRLSRMFSTSIEFVDEQSRGFELPANIQKPPRLNEARKGGSKLWAGFKFKELGDSANLPRLPKVDDSTAKENSHQCQNGAHPKPADSLGDNGDDHPYLSAEKTSIVNRWRTGINADASSESNTTPPPEPVVNSGDAPKGIAGLKKRRVAAVGANGLAVTPNASAQPTSAEEPAENHQSSKEATTAPVLDTDLKPKPTANGPVQSTPASKIRPKNQRWAAQAPQQRDVLIDLSEPTPAAATGSSAPAMFSQTPLVPRRPKDEIITPEQRNRIREKTNARPPVANSTAEHGSSLKHEIKIQEGDSRNVPFEPSSDNTHTSTNAPRIRKDPIGQEPNYQRAQVSRLGEREHDGSEVTSRRFHRTMRQQTPSTQSKKGEKAKQKAERQAVLAEAWGTPLVPNVNPSKISSAPEPSEWKKKNWAAEEQVHVDMVNDIAACLEPILDAANYFTGALSCEIQLGMILTPSPPSSYVDRSLNQRLWNTLFRPKHGVRPPNTNFISRLTTSGTDIDHLIELTREPDDKMSNMFLVEPSARTVQYEFVCKTKADEEIVICVDESGKHGVNRPEALFGSVNIHCPKTIWDMSVVVKGAQKYSCEADSHFSNAVKTLIDSLYIQPNRTEVLCYFKVPDGEELTPLKVVMRRITIHGCAQSPLAESRHGQSASNRSNGIPSVTKSSVRQASQQDVCLKITEVQNLYLGTTTTDKTLYRVRALEAGKMVDDSRLWYEASITSPTIEGILKSNKNLVLGANTNEWGPSDILGMELDESERGSTAKESSSTGAHAAKNISPKVGTSALGQMYRVANRVVEKIDVVGWANSGPAIDLPEGAVLQGAAAARSNFAAATSQGIATTSLGRGNGIGSSAPKAGQNRNGSSGNSGAMGVDFW